MPPRKKAAAADASGSSADPPKATRSSTRTKKTAQPPAAAAPAAKPKAKRARVAAADDAEDDEPKPSRKKSKKNTDDAEDDAPKVKDAPDADEDNEAQDDAPADVPQKMVTVIKRGAAPVDPMSGKVDTHQVLANDEGVWDAMLNQTDVSGGSNKNKFYVIQLLHPISNNNTCVLFTRWGRVGENGQTQVKGPWDAASAVRQFKSQFRAKAGVAWEDRVGMVAKKGDTYDLLLPTTINAEKGNICERDFDDKEDEEDAQAGPSKKKDEPIPDSKLAPEIQDLCNLMFSTSLIDAHLSSMNYDAKKLPLGKLAKTTILKGFEALKNLSEVIDKPNSEFANQYGSVQAACEHLTSAYYSIIPHDFGRTRPTVISTAVALKKELDLVDALGASQEIASKLIQSTTLVDDDGKPLNPIDSHFRSLALSKMEHVDRSTPEFLCLQKYVHDTHGHTHQNLKVNVQNIYRVERDSEAEAWNNAGFNSLGDGERFLLWHGSRTTNFAGILKQGLRIAPPEAPVTGYMFGKGVYFADMMSKSANYCYSYLSNNVGLLLLCEVAVKPFYERTDAQYDADIHCKSANARATKGIGKTQPLQWKDAGEALDNEELKGCHMPDSPGQNVDIPGVYLQYNEYIVYDPSQIRLRYLLMVQM
ncbi:hypothetical protein CCMSSC00406_0000085 [Pleurotus cornucopiae]|uniref:Uncharacterized protein n=1 Tax=Pleurotus cornucopiae TaxID=5321 RepID=A0ACB7IZC9_PLECO|nr:hypothetical protein CCMSSC00406_0000085 [Pleurotus cornucopiae]